jgi:agmatinase
VPDNLFRDPLSFAGLPVSKNFSEADVSILGVPYDCGEHPSRIGARSGPTWIRQHSELAREMAKDADPDPLASLRIVDGGDVDVGRRDFRDIQHFFDKTEKAIGTVHDSQCIPVTMGGDGAVSLPQIRAAARHYRDLTVLHFDAHTDAYPLESNNDYDNGTTFTHVAREGLVNLKASVHAGTRAAVNANSIVPYAETLGYRVIPFDRLADMTVDEAALGIRGPIGEKPVYLCFDMDFFDPAFAPGVCTPTPGGASAHFGLSLLRKMAGLNIVACDINTVSPPHDLSDGSTANLAATVILECLGLLHAGSRNIDASNKHLESGGVS